MSVLALVGLAVLWAIVLVPDLIRRSAASRRSDTIGNFSRTLSVLDANPAQRSSSNVLPFASRSQSRSAQLGGAQSRPALSQPVQPLQARTSAQQSISDPVRRAAPQRSPQPVSKSRSQQRRQEILVVLAAAAALTFLGTISFGGPMLVLNAMCDVLLVSYLLAMMAVARKEARPPLAVQTLQYQLPAYSGVVPVAQQRRVASR